MTTLVTGAGGQLGRALGRAGVDVALARAALDITDPEAIAAALDEHRPRVVINAAAYTAVDRAETDRLAAFAVNATGAARLAEACAARGIRLVHVSTDHVFAGDIDAPIPEDADPAPANVYGASKRAGERAVLAAGGTVVRTSWLFAPDGWGFVPAIVRAARADEPLRVVADRHGRPTSVDHLSRALLALADAPAGVYHVAGAEATTWHGLATAIVAALGLDVAVEPIASTDYPQPAARPRHAVLATGRAEGLGVEMPSWRPALTAAVAAIAAR